MPTISPNSGAEEKYRTFEMACELDEMPSDKNRPGASVTIEENGSISRATEWKYTKQRARKFVFVESVENQDLCMLYWL